MCSHRLSTTCYKVVELNRLVTSCSNNLLPSCNSTIYQQVVRDNLVLIVTALLQLGDKLATSLLQACQQVPRFLRLYCKTLHSEMRSNFHYHVTNDISFQGRCRRNEVFRVTEFCSQVNDHNITNVTGGFYSNLSSFFLLQRFGS
jgi:hypothetical protein